MYILHIPELDSLRVARAGTSLAPLKVNGLPGRNIDSPLHIPLMPFILRPLQSFFLCQTFGLGSLKRYTGLMRRLLIPAPTAGMFDEVST